ncbi:DNA-binding GntR family transcriptional regulator [Labrenzia sp. EL_126]|nr:DNA-binding GntR family transcriptional regulator [Labrenzia sp. EL_126]
MLFGGRNSDDETVVAMLASAIRRDISFGVLPPDEKLKIEALRQAYGGSNHSMRETLRMLSAEGLVEATSQRGFRVMSATQEDLEDILLMRIQTEKLGLSRAMERGDVAWESRVVAAFHALSRAEVAVVAQPEDITALEWDEACRAASETLLSACGSRRLIQIAGKFYNQSRRFRLALLREGRIDFLERADRLERLQRAVLSRDEVSALALLEEDIRADLGAGKTTARTQ